MMEQETLVLASPPLPCGAIGLVKFQATEHPNFVEATLFKDEQCLSRALLTSEQARQELTHWMMQGWTRLPQA